MNGGKQMKEMPSVEPWEIEREQTTEFAKYPCDDYLAERYQRESYDRMLEIDRQCYQEEALASYRKEMMVDMEQNYKKKRLAEWLSELQESTVKGIDGVAAYCKQFDDTYNQTLYSNFAMLLDFYGEDDLTSVVADLEELLEVMNNEVGV